MFENIKKTVRVIVSNSICGCAHFCFASQPRYGNEVGPQLRPPSVDLRKPSVQGASSLKLACRASATASKVPTPLPLVGERYTRLGIAQIAELGCSLPGPGTLLLKIDSRNPDGGAGGVGGGGGGGAGGSRQSGQHSSNLDTIVALLTLQ
jgi:hypothetical protein